MDLTGRPKIAAFQRELESCETHSACGRKYIRVEKLKRWMDTNMESLINEAYEKWPSADDPVYKNDICARDGGARIVFAILLDMGYGDMIDLFLQRDLRDRGLPFELHNLQPKIREIEEDLEDRRDYRLNSYDYTSFAKNFIDSQWRFCPIKLEFRRHMNCRSNQVFPVADGQKKIINEKGGTASIWQLVVLQEHLSSGDGSLQEQLQSSKFDDPADKLGECTEETQRYELVLKTFQPKNKQLWRREVQAFKALHKNEGMVKYLCDFQHEDYKTGEMTYNILLEYGEVDLDEFFFSEHQQPPNFRRRPPVFPEEIRDFWSSILELVEAVKDVHSFTKQRGQENQDYFGWHADIKPDNILYVKGRFKLADPGFACFEKSRGTDRLQKREGSRKMEYRGGTLSYAAPECGEGNVVTPAIDIWSLACVMSEAATWVVFGSQGNLEFIKVRKKGVEKSIRSDPSTPIDVQKGDFFHDGKEVLHEVRHWHLHLQDSARRSDNTTPQVIDLIDKCMLRFDPEKRNSAAVICEKMRQILSEHPEKVSQKASQSQKAPRSLRGLLIDIENEEPSRTEHPRDAQPETVQDLREAKKSKFLALPLVPTAHRSQILSTPQGRGMVLSLQPTSSGPHEQLSAVPQGADMPKLSQQGRGIRNALGRPDNSNPAGAREPQRLIDEFGPPNRTPTIRTTATQQPDPLLAEQNVWRARREVELRTKGLLKKKIGKDPLMTKYFGDRDIVFLVDDAESMEPHWDQAVYLLETLIMKATGQDENGIDLYFTNSHERLENGKDPQKFRNLMDDAKVRPTPNSEIRTDMRMRLQDIFFKYLKAARVQHKIRKMTVIVLTDGLWEGMTDKYELEGVIANFWLDLKTAQRNIVQFRQVSIQFIQFGGDEDASYRLRRLDEEMPGLGVEDIIDTEDAEGDVNKMLLGSFVPHYDRRKEDYIVIPRTLDYRGGPGSPPDQRNTNQRDSLLSPDGRLQASPPHDPFLESQGPIPSREQGSYSGHNRGWSGDMPSISVQRVPPTQGDNSWQRTQEGIPRQAQQPGALNPQNSLSAPRGYGWSGY